MFHPSIGIAFGSSDAKAILDIGYKFQDAYWKYASRWSVRNTSSYDLTYQRIVVRFGLLL